MIFSWDQNKSPKQTKKNPVIPLQTDTTVAAIVLARRHRRPFKLKMTSWIFTERWLWRIHPSFLVSFSNRRLPEQALSWQVLVILWQTPTISLSSPKHFKLGLWNRSGAHGPHRRLGEPTLNQRCTAGHSHTPPPTSAPIAVWSPVSSAMAERAEAASRGFW